MARLVAWAVLGALCFLAVARTPARSEDGDARTLHRLERDLRTRREDGTFHFVSFHVADEAPGWAFVVLWGGGSDPGSGIEAFGLVPVVEGFPPARWRFGIVPKTLLDEVPVGLGGNRTHGLTCRVDAHAWTAARRVLRGWTVGSGAESQTYEVAGPAVVTFLAEIARSIGIDAPVGWRTMSPQALFDALAASTLVAGSHAKSPAPIVGSPIHLPSATSPDEGSDGETDMGPWPPAFPLRGAANAPSVRRSTDVERAIDDALVWLAAHQNGDSGGWDAADFGRWCGGRPIARGESRDGAGKSLYDVGATGLALCAFLGAGYTHRGDHAYADVVGRGLGYLRNVQDHEGCFGARASQQFIYNHGAAALAMVEAYAMTGSPLLRSPAQKALDFIAHARNPYLGWRYGVKAGDNDTSVTGWMIMPLKSAATCNRAAIQSGRTAPFVIDEEAFRGARAWIDKVTDAETGRVGYMTRGSGPARPQEMMDRFPSEKSEAMTAVGVLVRILTGETPAASESLRRGIARCLACPPVWNEKDGSIDMIYWTYATLAMFQVGGDAWTRWQAAIEPAVVAHQRRDGDPCGFRGSWDPVDPWGPDGGRVVSTALMALTLMTASRYPREIP